MSVSKAPDEGRTDSVGMNELFARDSGIWGLGLLGGDLVHLHRIAAQKYLAIFDKTWVSTDTSGVNETAVIEETPTAYLIDTQARSRTALFPDGDRATNNLPAISADIEKTTVIGAASQGTICHILLDTEVPTIRTYGVNVKGMEQRNLLTLNPVFLPNGKTVNWNRGIFANGAQTFVFGADEEDQIYLSKRDTIAHTPFFFLAERQWSGNNKELSPLMANGRPLQAQGVLSMMNEKLQWVLTRRFGQDTTFWWAKHPRMGWKLASDIREKGTVRFQQAFGAVDTSTSVPYSIVTEEDSKLFVELKNFRLPR